MPTTILTQPYVLTAARDPAYFEVSGDGYVTDPPSPHATLMIAVDPLQPDPDSTITITVPDGRSTVLTAVTGTPDDSGTQYQIGADTEETMANFTATAQLNHLLSSLYQVVVVNPYATLFDSRTAGFGVVVMDFGASTWAAVGSTDEGSDGDVKSNYRVGLAVFVEEVWGSDVFVRLPEYHEVPNAAQRASVRLDTLLLPYLGWHWPGYDQSAVIRATDLQRRYYVSRWESYGTPALPREVVNSSVKQALFAGTRQLEHDAEWVSIAAKFRTGISSMGLWMTYRDRGGRHEVSPAQQHYLSWYCRVDRVTDNTHTLRAKVWYTDGTTTENNTATNNPHTGVRRDEIGIWPTGWNRLGLSAWNADRTPYKYQVAIVDGEGTRLSEWHEFWLVDPDVNELHIEFVSSLGAIESIRTDGKWRYGLTSSYQELMRALQPTNGAVPSVQTMARVQRTAGVQGTLEVFTGYVDKAEHQALCDIANSPEVRLVDHLRGTKIPLRLAAGNYDLEQMGDDGEFLHAMALKFEAHDPEMAWSNGTVLDNPRHL